MIIDARRVPQDSIVSCDVCIVGAGAAGITLAREFVGGPFKVCVLESGGLDFAEDTQSLYEGDVVGLPMDAPVNSRLRYFGGATNHWAGECRPLDDDDLVFRSWIPFSGWPITKDELAAYYRRAEKIVEIESLDWRPEFWLDQLPAFYRLPFMGKRLLPAIWQMSPPTRFGEQYREALDRADNIETYLHANVTNIEINDAGREVTRLRLACLAGNEFWVQARVYVLAAGGLENARLLLLSNKVRPAGIGNTFDCVGRFFSNHPKLDAAWIVLTTPRNLTKKSVSALAKSNVRLTLSPDIAEREGIAKFSARLHTTNPDGIYARSKGFHALRRIYRNFLDARIYDEFFSDVMNVAKDIDSVTKDLYNMSARLTRYCHRLGVGAGSQS